MAGVELELDRSGGRGLAEQIRVAFENGIRAGVLPAGRRLPSTRRLCAELGVSRSTVAEAFDLLRAEGLIEGVAGSGTYVSRLARLDGGGAGGAAARPPSHGRPVPAVINAFAWGPGLDRFPFDDWQRIGAETAARLRAFSGEADPAGAPRLREEIARHLARRRGLVCDPSQIIVTSGMTQGLDLLARTLLRSGDAAVMEDPAELRVRNTLLLAGARLSQIPVDGEGIEIDRAPRFALAHLSPVHQFPSGAVLSAGREAQVLDAAEASGGWVAEMDDTSLLTPPRRPILAGPEGGRGRVVYLATFSWTLFRSLRIGYLVAPPALIPRLIETRAAMDFRPPVIEQHMLEAFLSEGLLEPYIDRMRAILEPRDRALATGWSEPPAPGVRLAPRRAGLGRLLRLPDGADVEAILRRAAARGLEPRDVSDWFADPRARALLLGFAVAGEVTTRRGLRELADILQA